MLGDVLVRLRDLLDVLQINDSSLRQNHSTRGTDEKRHAQGRLQKLDVFSDGRLGQMQNVRRLRDALRLRHLAEHLQTIIHHTVREDAQ